MSDKPNYQIGTVDADDIDCDADSFDFAVDTAGSWDGQFPEPHAGDYLVTIGSVEREDAEILVSCRYTSACDPADAASLALDAFAERHDFPRDDEGNILPVPDPSDPDSGVTGLPCWIVRVDAVKDSTG